MSSTEKNITSGYHIEGGGNVTKKNYKLIEKIDGILDITSREIYHITHGETVTFVGHVNDSASSFTLTINGESVTVSVDAEGSWEYSIPVDVVVTSLDNAFKNAANLDSLRIVDIIDIYSCESMRGMFDGCTSLESIEFPYGFCTLCTDISDMFNCCSSLEYLNLDNWNTLNVESYDNFVPNSSDLTIMYNSETFNEEIVEAFDNVNWTEYNVISGHINDSDETFEFKINNETVTVPVKANGTWKYKLPSGTTVNTLEDAFVDSDNLDSIDLSMLDTSLVESTSHMFDGCSSLVSIDLSQNNLSSCEDMGYMFRGCSSLETFNFTNVDTSACTSMTHMFENCSFTDIDLTQLDISSCTNIDYMFNGCPLKSLNIRGWDSGSVTAYTNFVPNDSGLRVYYTSASFGTVIELSFPNTRFREDNTIYGRCSAGVTVFNFVLNYNSGSETILMDAYPDANGNWSYNIGSKIIKTFWYPFGTYANKIEYIDYSMIDVSEVTKINGMFSGCTNLKEFEVPSGFGRNCTEAAYLFNSCGLKTIDMTNFDLINCTDMSYLFYCSEAEKIILPENFGSNTLNMYGMFLSCRKLKNVNAESINTSSCTSFSNMFYDCESLEELNVSGWDTHNVTNLMCTFYNCSKIKLFDIRSWEIGQVSSYINFITENASLGNVAIYDSSIFNNTIVSNMSTITWVDINTIYGHVNDSSNTFSFKINGETVTVNVGVNGKWNYKIPSNTTITSLDDAFKDCTNLDSLTLISIDTSSCTNFSGMFSGCSSLENVDLRRFDTHLCTSFENMFNGCSSLEVLDISSFECGNSTTMKNMFYGCTSLTEINFGDFDTSSVVNMSGMFVGCSSFDRFDINFIDMSSCTDISGMFNGCSALVYLNMSECDTRNVTSYSNFVQNVQTLRIEYNRNIFNNDIVDSFQNVLWRAYNAIYGHVTDGSHSISFNVNGSSVASDVAANGNFIYYVQDEVTSLENAFYGITNIDYVDLSMIDTSVCSNITGMFNGCSSLSNVDLTDFNTILCTDINNVFNGCSSITVLDLRYFNTENVTSYTNFVPNSSSLTVKYDIDKFGKTIRTSFGNVNWINVNKYIAGTIETDNSLSSISFRVNTETVTAPVYDHSFKYIFDENFVITSLSQAFYDNQDILTLDLSHIDTSSCTEMDYMFYNCYNLRDINLENFNTSSCTNMNGMFNAAMNTIDNPSALASYIGSFDTSSVTEMRKMFYAFGDENSISLNLTGWDVHNVTVMDQMFSYNSVISNLNISTWVTSSCISMYGMFTGAHGSIQFPQNFGSVCTNMSEMFAESYMTTYDLSNFNTSMCTDMSGMFSSAEGSSVTLPQNFGSACTDMSHMFSYSMIYDVDLTKINVSSCTDISNMFEYSMLYTLHLDTWNTLSVTSYSDFVENDEYVEIYYTPSIFNNDIVSEYDAVTWIDVTQEEE